MKQLKYTLLIALVALAVGFTAAKAVQEQQQLKVELTIEGWNQVLEVVDQSNAPHQQVKAVQQALLGQLQEQLKTDSLNNK